MPAGIVEPVRGGNEAGLRLGLGKQEQEDFYMAAENVTRKRLETEVQAEEDTDRTQRREVKLGFDPGSAVVLRIKTDDMYWGIA